MALVATFTLSDPTRGNQEHSFNVLLTQGLNASFLDESPAFLAWNHDKVIRMRRKRDSPEYPAGVLI